MKPPPPPPPMPRPPPSDVCSSTTPIKASTIIRWMTMTTVCMSTNPFKRRPRPTAPGPRSAHIGSRGGLYTIPRRISTRLRRPADFSA